MAPDTGRGSGNGKDRGKGRYMHWNGGAAALARLAPETGPAAGRRPRQRASVKVQVHQIL